MNKKIWLAIVLAGVLAMILFTIGAGSGEKYSHLMITEDELSKIKSSRETSYETDVVIKFGEEELVKETETDRVFYSLIKGDSAAYDPSVSATLNGHKARVAFVDQMITDELIAQNGTIYMVIYTDEEYALKELKCTTLPILTVDSGTRLQEVETPMTMTLFDNRENATQREVYSEGQVVIRGGSTREYPKKPLKLVLTKESLGGNTRKQDIALLGLKKDSSWALYPCYNDQEKIRNVFSMNLWAQSCGTDNAYAMDTGLTYEYTELFVNGEYYGLYAIGHTEKRKYLGLNEADGGERLFKKVEDHLNGYSVKYNNIEDMYSPEAGRELGMVYDYFFNLDDHKYDPEYLRDYIDLDNSLDFFLFINLAQGRDNLQKNYYLALKNTGDHYKGVYIPWDMDISWGNEWLQQADLMTNPYGFIPQDNFVFKDSYLYQIIYDQDEEILDQLVAKYEYLRAHGWSDEVVGAMLDQAERDIFFSGAYLRDKDRWPEGHYLADGENDLSRFKAYVRERFAETDRYYASIKENPEDNQLMDQVWKYDEYNPSFFTEIITDPGLYLEALRGVDGEALVQINDPDTILGWNDTFLDGFDADLGQYESLSEAAEAEDKLVLLMNGKEKKAVLISDPYADGMAVETDLGEYSCYHVDDSNYVIYINGNEMKIEDTAILDERPFDVMITDNWQEVISEYSDYVEME